ncbi:OsmC family protein [Noviherbaspirillum sp. CPCC 100848]|uniref:OsmC family protein n=1 Tax=Noviherbaspirillum album TaxID=3080276 RepID=A0ABU6JDN5_9BURK|nr:OsmC family protein [Noviherbaspirillum sp. CPCC 100848]MEC4721760.1 OsmC family protein [Noviherbaspirillum sp. CPCC 100848]
MATVHSYSDSGYRQILSARHHELKADEPVAQGGTDTGPAPYELLLASLAACTSLTLRMYGDRKEWKLGRIEVDLEFFRDSDGAEHITRTVRIGAAIDEEKRQRLADICERTPVTKTLMRSLAITTVLQAR